MQKEGEEPSQSDALLLFVDVCPAECSVQAVAYSESTTPCNLATFGTSHGADVVQPAVLV